MCTGPGGSWSDQLEGRAVLPSLPFLLAMLVSASALVLFATVLAPSLVRIKGRWVFGYVVFA